MVTKHSHYVLHVCLVLASALLSEPLAAQAPRNTSIVPSDSTTVVRPGLILNRIVDPRGPWTINILSIDLTQPDLAIGSARAHDKFLGREQTSSMAKRHNEPGRTVVAAMNSDFFDLKSGEIENNNIIDADFVKGTKMTGSPFDTFDNIHSQFALTQNKKPLIDRFEFAGTVVWQGGSTTDLYGVNDRPKSNSIVLYNHFYGAITPTDTLKMTIAELTLAETFVRFDTLYGIISRSNGHGGTPIAKTSVVLAGYNLSDPSAFAIAKPGDPVKIYLGLKPNRGLIETLVGGWPRIVLNGKSIAASADSLEGTFPRFSVTRHPRSGVGFSRDSSKVFFFTVDGRRESGVGMSLVEFADLMLSHGVYQGLNVDGGGSTTLVINGSVVNSPSDATGERAVGNCLLVYTINQK
jgi:hypothetical protein